MGGPQGNLCFLRETRSPDHGGIENLRVKAVQRSFQARLSFSNGKARRIRLINDLTNNIVEFS